MANVLVYVVDAAIGRVNEDNDTAEWFRRHQQTRFPCAPDRQHGQSVYSVWTSFQPTQQETRRTGRRRTVSSRLL